MVADCVPVVCPNMSEILNKFIVFVVALHFLKQIAATDVELPQYGFQCDQRNFGLEEIGSIQTIKTIGPEYSVGVLQNLIFLGIIDVISQIDLHVAKFLNNFIHFLIVPTLNFMMKIVVQIFECGIHFAFYVTFQLFDQHVFAFLAH